MNFGSYSNDAKAVTFVRAASLRLVYKILRAARVCHSNNSQKNERDFFPTRAGRVTRL